ncbi:heterokaryon incompatibility protein [Seiridium cupressi]
MSSSTKVCYQKSCDLMQVHEYCPRRSYVELAVPFDIGQVVAVTFTTLSRDQGWADQNTSSHTYFEAQLHRSTHPVKAVKTHSNRPANSQFHKSTVRWEVNDADLQPESLDWIHDLRGGDVIQLIPVAWYPGWVNIIKEAEISLEYEPTTANTESDIRNAIFAANDQFYKRKLQYEPQSDTVRTLIIAPGRQNDPIYASFEYKRLEHDLTADERFIALSYCWGSDLDHEDLLLQSAFGGGNSHDELNSKFAITRTVASAIRKLRDPEKHVSMWIDAICINQYDLVERAQQVSLMADIFSYASTVHIWLGNNVPGLGAALRVLRDVYNLSSQECQGGERCRCMGTRHSSLVELKKHIEAEGYGSWRNMFEVFDFGGRSFSPAESQASGFPGSHFWFLMESLFGHPWFERVWVVQEALKSSRSMIHADEDCIGWSELIHVHRWMSEPQFRDQATVKHLHGRPIMPPLWNQLSQDRPTDTGLGSLLDIFLATLDMKATDPRDRLFAVLGFSREINLSGSIPLALNPDYEKSLGLVMANFTRWCIIEQRSLAVLSFVHCRQSRAWRKTSPTTTTIPTDSSFEPTWALSPEGYSKWQDLTLQKGFPRFNAAAHTLPDEGSLQGDADSDPLVLQLKGRSLGVILDIGHPPLNLALIKPDNDLHGNLVQPHAGSYHTEDKPEAEMALVFNYLMDPCGQHASWTRPLERNPDIKSLSHGAWMRRFHDHASSHTMYVPSKPTPVVRPSGQESHTTETPTRDQIPSCVDPCFFVTTNGHYGLCPRKACVGDIVVALDGGPLPYLLRQALPVNGGSGKARRNYEFIGECYLQGFMYGEAYKDMPTTLEDDCEVFTLI